MHNNYLKFFNLFVIRIIIIIRPPLYLWILGIVGFFIWSSSNLKYLGECEVFTLTLSWNKNFQQFWVENLRFASIFRSARGSSNGGPSSAAKRDGGHQLVGAAKPQTTKASGCWYIILHQYILLYYICRKMEVSKSLQVVSAILLGESTCL